MDNLIQQYQMKAQEQLNYAEQLYTAFKGQCDKLQLETEKQLDALDKNAGDFNDKSTQIKYKLKLDLDLTLKQFEKELRKSFGKNVDDLEKIYRIKENERLEQIEKEISTY